MVCRLLQWPQRLPETVTSARARTLIGLSIPKDFSSERELQGESVVALATNFQPLGVRTYLLIHSIVWGVHIFFPVQNSFQG